MKHRLVIVEGLPCSGKSTTSAFIASLMQQGGKVCFVDEGTGNHPADYEFHALAPAGLLSPNSQIVSLAQFTGVLFDQLLQYKIYDYLPWETEMPIMLEKWREFVRNCEKDGVYVFNCVLLQNPMCETMMRFGFSQEESQSYIEKIVHIIKPLNPMVVYLKNDDIADSVSKAAQERPGWLEAVIDYHITGAYGRSIHAEGFRGYIECLKERQERELQILAQLPIHKLIVENPQRDWRSALEMIKNYFLNS